MAGLGVEFERLTVNVIKSDGKNRMNLKAIDDDLFKPDTNPWIQRWWLYDVVSVIIHECMINAFMTPIVCFIIFQSHLHWYLGTRPTDEFLILSDVKYRWWLIPDKMMEFPYYTWVAVGLD
jgi:hypothetical protein